MSIGNYNGCKKNNKLSQIPISYFANDVHFRVQDTEGRDLVNAQTTGHYKVSDIEISETTDKANAVYIAKYHPGKNYYYVKISLNLPDIKENEKKHHTQEVTTKVRFGNLKTDVIKGLFDITYHEGNNPEYFGTDNGYTIILQKAWFNNSLIYDKEDAENNPNWELPIITKPPNK